MAGNNLCYPDYPWSVEGARHQDNKWDHSRFFKMRIVAEEDGRIVGSVDVWVLPDRRRRGHGSALHDAAVKILNERNALAATAGVKESMTDGVEFTRKRGWVEVKRDWESRLVVAGFDVDRFAGATERVASQGIRISTYTDELVRDADAPQKAFELTDLCRRDVLATDAPTALAGYVESAAVDRRPHLHLAGAHRRPTRGAPDGPRDGATSSPPGSRSSTASAPRAASVQLRERRGTASA